MKGGQLFGQIGTNFGIPMEIGLGMEIAITNLPHEAPEGAWGGGGGYLLSQNVNILGHAECQFQLCACGLAVLAIINHISGCPGSVTSQ